MRPKTNLGPIPRDTSLLSTYLCTPWPPGGLPTITCPHPCHLPLWGWASHHSDRVASREASELHKRDIIIMPTWGLLTAMLLLPATHCNSVLHSWRWAEGLPREGPVPVADNLGTAGENSAVSSTTEPPLLLQPSHPTRTSEVHFLQDLSTPQRNATDQKNAVQMIVLYYSFNDDSSIKKKTNIALAFKVSIRQINKN